MASTNADNAAKMAVLTEAYNMGLLTDAEYSVKASALFNTGGNGLVEAVCKVDLNAACGQMMQRREDAVWRGTRPQCKQVVFGANPQWRATCVFCAREHVIKGSNAKLKARVAKEESMCPSCKSFAATKLEEAQKVYTGSENTVCIGTFFLLGEDCLFETQHDVEGKEAHLDFSICGHEADGSSAFNIVRNSKLVEDAHNALSQELQSLAHQEAKKLNPEAAKPPAKSFVFCVQNHPQQMVTKMKASLGRSGNTKLKVALAKAVDHDQILARVQGFALHKDGVWNAVQQHGIEVRQAKETKAGGGGRGGGGGGKPGGGGGGGGGGGRGGRGGGRGGRGGKPGGKRGGRGGP